jgi:parallel beta-helix repeat protein
VIDNSIYYGIRFYGGGDALNILNNKIMNSGNYGIYSYGTGSLNTLVIKDNQISGNAGGGANIDGVTYSSLSIENNIFSSNSNYPLTFNAAYLNSSKGNAFISNTPDEIKLLAGTIDIDSNMRYQGVPYRIAGTVNVYRSVGLAPTLTIEPGNTLKFDQYNRLNVGVSGVGGKLVADSVTFTGSTASKGWWSGISFGQNSDGSIINNSKIEYGGYGNNANVQISSSSVDVSNSIIANNSYAGIYSYGTNENVNIINNEIRGSVYGIYKYGSSALVARENKITGNDYGVYFTSSSNGLVYNNYFNNTVNVWDNGNNKWNISKTPGSNIIGGPNLGGNYWSDYTGVDTDLDGLGNTLLPYNSSGKITTGGDRHPLVYTGENKPPVANCGPDKLKCENVASPVQFNGSASFDPDGTIVSYSWEFGDGTAGSGMAPNHPYKTYRWNGSTYLPFTVNLTITDNGGLTNTTSQKVVIWIAGDANGDGKVNILDAAIVGLKWNGKDPCADLNNDGKVNILDAAIIGLNWNKLA